MKQKIVVFHPALATYRIDFFNTLAKYFEAVFYFEYKEQFSQKYSKDYLSSKCNFKSQYLDKGFEFLGRGVRFSIGSVIRNENPEIVICSEYGPTTLFVLLYCLLSNRKFKIYTICDDSLNSAKQRSVLRYFVRYLVSKKIDGVIFISDDVSSWYKNNISSKPKALVFPIIHNEEIFRPELLKSIKTANENISKYNLENKKILLFVGRLEKVKNLSFLLDVVSQLEVDNWVLIIVGSGNLMEDLKNQTRELGLSNNVLFTNNKEGKELLSWYAIAQIFILPSTFEPFGAVVNEALLSGCLVLCSKLAGSSTLITEENGALFMPHKKQELLELLENALHKIDPLQKEISKLTKSGMPFTFADKVNALIKNL